MAGVLGRVRPCGAHSSHLWNCNCACALPRTKRANAKRKGWTNIRAGPIGLFSAGRSQRTLDIK